MQIALHKNARTTPAVRAEIAASTEPVSQLARRYSASESTVRKWRERTDFHDASHTAHTLQTTLSPIQEKIVVELRKMLLLPLGDLLAVTREFLCAVVSQSGLDRCLRRHGVGNLRALRLAPDLDQPKSFKAYEPGCLHRDVKYLPQMAEESRRRYRCHRPRHALGLRRDPSRQDGGQRATVSERAVHGMSDQDRETPDGQRQRVHRPTVCQTDDSDWSGTSPAAASPPATMNLTSHARNWGSSTA